MKRLFFPSNIRSQTAVEYLLLVTVTAVIVFAAFKGLVPRAQTVSNQFYNKVAVGIMGPPPDSFPLPTPTVRLVAASSGSVNDLRVSCNNSEYVVGGGCYYRYLSSSPQDMHMRTESTETTRGGNYYCHSRDNDTLHVYALCANFPADCHVVIGNTNQNQSIYCPAGETMTGGGCYVRNPTNGQSDDLHVHPRDGGQVCATGESSGTAYVICCRNLGMTCRVITATNSPDSHHCRVRCNPNEFLTGGGCYLRGIESGGSDDVHIHPENGPSGITTQNAAWYCEQNDGDYGGCTAYAICCG